MTFRRFVLVTHRWLGLTSSAVIAAAGATGAILVWSDYEVMATLSRYASPLHERLALGKPGYWTVVVATAISVLLEAGGIVLWWKTKTLLVRRGSGWWRMCYDLHHMIGAVLLPLMLIVAVTGVGLAVVGGNEQPALYQFLARWHKGHFPLPIKVLYTIASLAFVAQGLTGFVMWWRPVKPQNKVAVSADKSLEKAISGTS
jgi:uncharacterized iron-regulated membrane protein